LRVVSIAAVAALAGCGTMPSQVAYPGVSSTSTANPRDDYTVGGKKLSDPAVKGILPVARTFDRAKAQIDAHYATWTLEASNLNTGRDTLSNTKFGGAVVGAIGAIVSKVDITKVGAAAAGGAGVWDSQYQLKVQAENYRLAADAMRCIHKQVTKLPPAFWDATYETTTGREGSMKLSIEDYEEFAKKGDELTTGYNTLQSLFDTINASVNVVRDRLQVKQEAVALATPSAEAIQTALTSAAKEKSASESQAQAMKAASPAKRADLDDAQVLTSNAMRSVGTEAVKNESTQKLLQRHSALVKRLVGDYSGSPAAPTPQQLIQLQFRIQALKQAADITKADYATAIQLPAELNTCMAQISK
jgi:hypothetical protein